MILGRPVNQWVGLITAAGSLVLVLVVNLAPDVDPKVAATIIGSVVTFLGIVVAFIAAQPPTLNPGDPYTVVTPNDAPNVTKVANTNVTATPPVVQ